MEFRQPQEEEENEGKWAKQRSMNAIAVLRLGVACAAIENPNGDVNAIFQMQIA